jgi:hypothetical protein
MIDLSRPPLAIATEAMTSGRLDEAARAFRAHFAERIATSDGPLTSGDARAAAAAAALAVLRHDDAELAGVEALLVAGTGDDTQRARLFVATLQALIKGEVPRRETLEAEVGSDAPLALMPDLLLAVAERDLALTPTTIVDELERSLDTAPFRDPGRRGRASIVLAVAARRRSDRDTERRLLADIGTNAPPAVRALAAFLADDPTTGVAALEQMLEPHRTRLRDLAAKILLRAEPSSIRAAVAAFGVRLPKAHAARLLAACAMANLRAGDVTAATAAIGEARVSGGGPIVEHAAAILALAKGDVAGVVEARGTGGDASVERAIELLVAATSNNGVALVEAILASPTVPAFADYLQGVLLAAIARAGATLDAMATPAWLARRPTDPVALFGWGALRHAHGVDEEALAALEEATRARPTLRHVGDLLDVVRLSVGAASLSAGDAKRAQSLASNIESPRLARLASNLLALSRAALAWEGLRDDAGLERAAAAIEPSSAEGTYLRSLLGHRTARHDLQTHAPTRARATLDALGPPADPETAYVHAAASILEDQRALRDIGQDLQRVLDRDDSYEPARVLMAELRAALGGVDRVDALEATKRPGSTGGLVEEALATAYRDADRGLDAKRVAIAEARRTKGAIAARLEGALRAALELESPPKTRRRSGAAIARLPRGSLLPRERLEERLHVLLARAGEVARTRPQSARRIEEEVRELKGALVGDDLQTAHGLELRLVETLGGDG